MYITQTGLKSSSSIKLNSIIRYPNCYNFSI
ncbi:hypothetical protein NC651_028934 [Populus alba x Populus x berolinensis]|nr:hypothetical protein NC651_028934 [Populus alba x Populus x berolinensis]